MTAQIILVPADFFARQHRDQDPGTHHDDGVIILPVIRPERYGERAERATQAPRGFDAGSRHWSGDPDNAA